MKITVRDAILTAISYADIFDYPLTREELRVWLPYINSPAASRVSVLRSQKRLIAIRKKREAWSQQKWIRARGVVNLLRIIPTIALIGVTGGLARSNAKAEDDIDLLIITAPKTLWVTRGLSTIFLDLLRLRRRPNDTKFRNLICLNMFMSEDGLTVPIKERDLFVAHEVLLMTPLWERNGTYVTFLRANAWVRKFLPNAWRKKCQMIHDKRPMKKQKGSFRIWHLAFSILEQPSKKIQMWYMNGRRTTESISEKVIRFHPRDARVWIKIALGRRLSRFNIPLDKIFYGR